MTNIQKIIIIGMFFLFIAVCFADNENDLPGPLMDMDKFFSEVPFTEDNPYDSNMVIIGQKLFFDPILSSNNKISCSSCHKPEFAFSDTVRFNVGVSGIPLKRNSMSLTNLAWDQHYFWDGRIGILEDQIISPITDKDEMGLSKQLLSYRLTNDSDYCNIFYLKLHLNNIDYKIVSKSIAQYLRKIVCTNGDFDKKLKYLQKFNPPDLFEETFKGYSPNLKRALHLCAECHNSVFYGGQFMKNNGLDSFPDLGYYIKSKDSSAIGLFKVPVLRNVALTAPYMHDGRFKTLEEVVEHYNSGIIYSRNLDKFLIENGQPIRLQLSKKDKEDMVEFLRSMTDTAFIKQHEISPKFN